MAATEFADLNALSAAVGHEVAVGDWRPLGQQDIDGFADLTGDHQWIHVDVERARRDSPYGVPIAHAFLSLALLAGDLQRLVKVGGIRLGVVYGLNKVRFPTPLPVASQIRSRIVLQDLAAISGGVEAVWRVSVEREGTEKPVCVAEVIVRYLGAT